MSPKEPTHSWNIWWMYFWLRIPIVPTIESPTVEMVEAWIMECNANVASK